MASKDSDVPASVPSSPATPSPSAPGTYATSSARHSCPRCARRMSNLKYDKHSICVACRDSQCSVDVRCSECNSWSLDFMLGYVKCQKSSVSKGKEVSSSSSPSKPPAVTTTAPVAPPPSLPASTEDQLRCYVHSFLADFMQSQSGQLGTNQFLAAPPAVPNSASLLREVTVGLGADSPTGLLPNPLARCC